MVLWVGDGIAEEDIYSFVQLLPFTFADELSDVIV